MPYAVDLFCGAGGFSEGVLQAGFDIVFSSDISPMAKETYTNRHRQLGIMQGKDTHFELTDIKNVSSDLIFESINKLKYGDIFRKGTIDVIFGGPPCQGFSRLGKRDTNDPRNMLFHEYLRIIKEIKPKYVVMENVKGILDMKMLDFPSVIDNNKYLGQNLVESILQSEFKALGYNLLDVQMLNSANFGVPQQRNRVVFLAYRKDVEPIYYPESLELPVTVHDALGDLYSDTDHEYSTNYSKDSVQGRTPSLTDNLPVRRTKITNMVTSKHENSVIERFSLYKQGENKRMAINRLTETGIDLKKVAPNLFYESLFHINDTLNTIAIQQTLNEHGLLDTTELKDSWFRFTNRQLSILYQYEVEEDEQQFNQVLTLLAKRLGTTVSHTFEFWNKIKSKLNKDLSIEQFEKRLLDGDINDLISEAIFTKKGIRTRLYPYNPSPTMVTLPDDFIHPFFDRTLTVREMARFQSFDDSFEFLGKRTTGGNKRALETPQFTQIGNAVPPLLARAIAEEVFDAIKRTELAQNKLPSVTSRQED